jgi:rubrerythrin
MSKVTDGLKNAFAGESQANRRYLAFARKAQEEGLPRLQNFSEQLQRRRQFTP